MTKLTTFQILSIVLGLISIIVTLYIFLKESNNQAQNTQLNGLGGPGSSPAPPGGSLPGDPPLLAPGEVPPAPGGAPPPVVNNYAEIFYSGTEFQSEITIKYYNQINKQNETIGTNPGSIISLIDNLFRKDYISQTQAEFLMDWVNIQGP